MRASVATSTARTFSPGIKEYISFCHRYDIIAHTPTPADLEMFVAHLSVGRMATTVRVYLSAVRHYLLCNNGPVELLRSARLAAMVKGLDRTSKPPRSTLRKAVTLQDLAIISKFLSASNYGNHDRAMLWAAITVGFYGLLRAGEYTSASATATPAPSTLTCSQVEAAGSSYKLFLGRTKTSQDGNGGTVFLSPSGGPICAVSALNCYLSYDPLSQREKGSPLFRFADGRFLTRDDISLILRSALRSTSISSHSLRIGGATHMATAGASEQDIQLAGRWRSRCYLRYVRQDAGMPANYTASDC